MIRCSVRRRSSPVSSWKRPTRYRRRPRTLRPAAGQLLLDVERCGICGSDLHARGHADELADVLGLCGYPRYIRSAHTVVLGHEIYGRVVDVGPWSTSSIPLGTPVVTVPLVRRGRQVDGVGLSADAPGGYAEHVVVRRR